jgi:predicted transposase/invertase (TIGR01784 family)
MNQHQDYDKIFKENIEKIGASLLSKLCGLELVDLEQVSTTIPRTLERRADFVRLGVNVKTMEKMLSHIEFQAKSQENMDSRMLFYYSLYYEMFRLPIRQYVIYLGSGNWTASTQIHHDNLAFSYEVISLNTIDYELFVNSESPEEIILAILADFKGERKDKVIKKIITCLKSKTKNKRKLQKLIIQLEILSNLRKLQAEVIKNLSAMSINYDIKEDIRYQQGVEQGIEQGLYEGIEQGIEQGDLLRAKKIVKKMLLKGAFSLQEIADLAEVSIDFVMEMQNEINAGK